MKILLAHPDLTEIDVIEAILLASDHEVISTNNGNEVMAAMLENPDMALIDTNLNGISGYECCRLIKHNNNARHKPVILLMQNQDSTAWARFAECGADDFIQYPLHPHAIETKIKLLVRIGELYKHLDASHRRAEQEIRLAKHMFDTITKRQPKEIDFMHFWGLSAGHFCGDLFIFERTPNGHLHVFLGDFTGHGLAAAMGALPTSDIFFSMTRNGSGAAQIISEINSKLYEIMPTGKFCAATFLRLEPDCSRLEIWNGGLPPVMLADKKCKIAEECHSLHLPLGILEPAELNPHPSNYSLEKIQSVVLCSGGLIEAQNSLGEIYGEARLAQVIASNLKDRNVFDKIKSSALSFLEGLEPHDDISLAVIHLTQKSYEQTPR